MHTLSALPVLCNYINATMKYLQNCCSGLEIQDAASGLTQEDIWEGVYMYHYNTSKISGIFLVIWYTLTRCVQIKTQIHKPTFFLRQISPLILVHKVVPRSTGDITCCVWGPTVGWFGQECPGFLCHQVLHTLRLWPQEVALIHCNWFVSQYLAMQKGQKKELFLSFISLSLFSLYHHNLVFSNWKECKYISCYTSWKTAQLVNFHQYPSARSR